jgi:hypothetical protein
MNLFKRYPKVVLLTLACLLVALGLSLEYRWLKRRLEFALQVPPVGELPQPGEEAPALAELPPREAFTAFIAQPLFIEGRKPLPEEAEAGALETKKPPEVHLTGIITAPNALQLILVRDQSNKTLRLKPGEAIDGWRVAELKDDQVILQQNGKTHILKLIKPRPLKPPPPSPRPLPPQSQAPNPFTEAIKQQAMAQQKQE